MIADGTIDPRGKSAPELRREFVAFWATNPDVTPVPVIDHRTDLLRAARRAVRVGDFLISCLLYATWSEHWLNGLIDQLARRKGFSGELTIEIVRESSMRAKLRWVMPLLGAPRLNSVWRAGS